MGTRSVVGTPTENGGFRGRYVHWDGYPEAKVPTYLTIVRRDGLERALAVLTQENYGWSSVKAEQPDITGVTPDIKAPYGTPENEAASFGQLHSDGRFRNIPGYGIAYTTEQNQSNPDEWVDSDGDDWGTEWAYVLSEAGITVHERVWNDGDHMTGMFGMGGPPDKAAWAERFFVPWDATEDEVAALIATTEG